MSHRSDRSRLSSLSTIRPSPSPTSPIVSLLEPPTYIRHHYPGRPLPTPPIEVPPPSSSAYESLPLPRSATATRLALTLNVPSEMSDMMMTEKSTTTSSGLTYLADRPISPLSIASGSSIAEAINEADGETLGIEAKDLDLLISRIDSNDGGTYQELPTVPEVAGEAGGPGTARRHDRPDDSTDIPLVGPIEVQRHRKLKDGRVKLKLRLMGVFGSILAEVKALCCFGPIFGGGRLNRCGVHTQILARKVLSMAGACGAPLLSATPMGSPVRRGQSRKALPLLRLTPYHHTHLYRVKCFDVSTDKTLHGLPHIHPKMGSTLES